MEKQLKILLAFLAIIHLHAADIKASNTDDGKASLHFNYQTGNGQQRVEDIKYEITKKSIEDVKHAIEVSSYPVEVRGGYSFISADGYEYTVKYKANKNGFQPYVTAHKLINPPAIV